VKARSRAVSRWTAAWPGGAAIGIANGIAREVTYGERMTEQRAHQVSVATAIAAFAAYFRQLQRRWPIQNANDAAAIGAVWLALTVLFEFSFGRLAAKQSWRELLTDYNLRRGRLWPLVLVWLAIGPELIRKQQPTSTSADRD
jgi:hypothetical protein